MTESLQDVELQLLEMGSSDKVLLVCSFESGYSHAILARKTPWCRSLRDIYRCSAVALRRGDTIVGRLCQILSGADTSGMQILHQQSSTWLSQVDQYLEAVIEVNPEAVQIAEELDAERKAGKVRSRLHGIPVLVKDVSLVNKETYACSSWNFWTRTSPQRTRCKRRQVHGHY